MASKKTQLENKFDEFRDKISTIQKAVRQIKKTGISDSILFCVILQSSQRFYKNRYYSPLTIAQVKAIIEGLENLKEYVFTDEIADGQVEKDKGPNLRMESCRPAIKERQKNDRPRTPSRERATEKGNN